MAELTPDERRAGRMAANALTEMASTLPDLYGEKVLHRAAHLLLRHYGYSAELKAAEIVRRVRREMAGMTFTDLKTELGFHIGEIRSIIRKLEETGQVACRKVPPAGNRGGRPTTLVTYIGKNGVESARGG